jgi:glycosyltransferase involved in cell wall biosynthesis
MSRVLIIGPAHPLRGGGLTTFNHRLAQEFISNGIPCSIVSFSLQYPSILFPGKTQFTNEAPPEGIEIHPLINSVNPLNWISIGYKIKSWKPDIIIVRYWLPFMGPALGSILRIIKKNRHSKIICIADNIIPHEKRIGDKTFSTYFLKACDGFITMSENVKSDLLKFVTNKPVELVPHPLYDIFGEIVSKENARKHLLLDQQRKIILFFGFIRKYKGLDLLLQAMTDKRIQIEKIILLIAGEFYDNKKLYLNFIRENNLEKSVIIKNEFISGAEVKYYLCAADCVIQPYKSATQSGVTPLAYYFQKPMIVTNVGGLPALVPHKKAGLVCEANSPSLANAILEFYKLGENCFIPFLQIEKQKYSWKNFVTVILQMAEAIR